MSLLIEAVMLFKIKAVTRDLRKFSSPIRLFIILNLNELLDRGDEGGGPIQKSATFKAGMSLKTNGVGNGGGSITREVDENK
jgi:hypothetical protein